MNIRARQIRGRPAHQGSSHSRRLATRMRASHGEASLHDKLDGIRVLRATTGESCILRDEWGVNDRIVLAFTRSLGCPFCQELAIQLRRDIKPNLDEMGIKLKMVTIGTPEKSAEFCRKTGFPIESLLLDPEQATYRALDLKETLQDTFFNPATPLSLIERGE